MPFKPIIKENEDIYHLLEKIKNNRKTIDKIDLNEYTNVCDSSLLKIPNPTPLLKTMCSELFNIFSLIKKNKTELKIVINTIVNNFINKVFILKKFLR